MLVSVMILKIQRTYSYHFYLFLPFLLIPTISIPIQSTAFNDSLVYFTFLSFFILFSVHLGLVVRKPVNTNPGLKVNRCINFS